MRLFRLVAHPSARRRGDRLSVPRYSHVSTFRRFPREWPDVWKALLRGDSRAALEELSLRLLDHAGARARGAGHGDDHAEAAVELGLVLGSYAMLALMVNSFDVDLPPDRKEAVMPV